MTHEQALARIERLEVLRELVKHIERDFSEVPWDGSVLICGWISEEAWQRAKKIAGGE